MAVKGGVGVRGILHHVAAGLLLDNNLAFVNLALLIKDSFQRLVGVFALMSGIACKLLYQSIHILRHLLTKQTA